MNCALDSIKNNRLAIDSLVVVGLTAVGAAAHRLGLLTLCSKALSAVCGHVAAVVQRHRFASIALAAVGVLTLVSIVAAIRSSKYATVQPPRPSYQRLPSEKSELARCRQINLFGEEANNIEERVRDLVSHEPLPLALERKMSEKKFNLTLDDQTLEQLISNVLIDFLQGKTTQFYHFFEPSYLTLPENEGDEDEEGKISSLKSQRGGEYAKLMTAIICHYHQLLGKEVLHCDWIGGICEVQVGSETKSSMHRSPYLRHSASEPANI
jgi:hypothetical protein